MRIGPFNISKWETVLGLGLIVMSALLFFLHFSVFKDAHHIFIYALGDLAFLPIEVFLLRVLAIEFTDRGFAVSRRRIKDYMGTKFECELFVSS